MSEAKFTPGPWHIDDLTTFDESKNKHSGTFDIKTKEGCEGPFKVVCSVNAYGGNYFPNRDEAHVNAKLIAVAPELLVCLKDCIENILIDFADDDPRKLRYKAAIEKATL